MKSPTPNGSLAVDHRGCSAGRNTQRCCEAGARIRGLEAYVAKALQASKIPGIAIAIVRNDSVLYTKGFGVLKVGTSTPVNDQTLFEIGSSSKAFTATLGVDDGVRRQDAVRRSHLEMPAGFQARRSRRECAGDHP